MTVTKNAIKLDLFEERMRKIMMFGLIMYKKGLSHSYCNPKNIKKLRHIFMRGLHLETISFVPYIC